VLGDPILLERILSNLVANALRYTQAGGVVVGCRPIGSDRLSVEVWDSGIGVAAHDQGRIFEEFVQVGNPERDRRKGLGLGLAIAQRTAVLLDTRIFLTSRPGRGSVFRFALPRAQPETQPVRQVEPSTLDAVAGLRVLVIDDEESIRDALSRLLGQWGAEIEAVAGPEEAEVLLRGGRRFDVVLADFRLPHDKTGIEAIRAIRKLQSPQPRACLVTGDVDAGLIGAARAEGLPLLHKPMRPAQLRAVLNFLASQPEENAMREPAPVAP
jgi:CheY-like chemotaxis protein